MENANGNIGIRVVSPDRPSKGSVAINENHSAGRCGGEQRSDDRVRAVKKEKRSEPQHQEPVPSTRRNSSIGLSLLAEETIDITTSEQGYPYAKLYTGLTVERRDYQCSPRHDDSGVRIPPYRPLVGSGAAAAYEALRHDFYVQKNKNQRRMSSLSFGSAKGCELDYIPPKKFAPRPHGDEQFEMLKLHYFNLVNEIQETAMMLNICEQHQLVMLRQQAEFGQHPGGPEPSLRAKRSLPTDGSFEVSIPTKIVKL